MREQGLELLMNGAVSQPPAKASAMPVVGSNSLAIAAACHPAFNDSSLEASRRLTQGRRRKTWLFYPFNGGLYQSLTLLTFAVSPPKMSIFQRRESNINQWLCIICYNRRRYR